MLLYVLVTSLLLSSVLLTKPANVWPVANRYPFWDGGMSYHPQLTIQAGEHVNFTAAFGIHNVWIANRALVANADTTFATCDVNTMVQTWSAASCSCVAGTPTPPADGCNDIRNRIVQPFFSGVDPRYEQCSDVPLDPAFSDGSPLFVYSNILKFSEVGIYYAACTAGDIPDNNHCEAGMHLIINVVEPTKPLAITPYTLPFSIGAWGFYANYQNLQISTGDSVLFSFDAGIHNIWYTQELSSIVPGFNNLNLNLETTKLQFCPTVPLTGSTTQQYEVGTQQITANFFQGTTNVNSDTFNAFITSIQLVFPHEGTYFVLCGQPGHCGFGMNFFVTVTHK